jgi:predicted dehydrogenase
MDKKTKIRWAILGAGRIANSFTKDFPLMYDADLVAVAASDRERAKKFATQYNIPQALSYDELYASKEIDAVYIATTHNFHFEQALKCLQNGKAVLCEKPVTVNDKEFKVLMELSKNKKLFFMEAIWTYFLPAIFKARQWMDEGKIGKLKVIQADFAFAMEKNLEGRLYNPMLAGGSLLDLGIYPIALAYYFTNKEPLKITATATMTSTGVDESVAMNFQYGDVIALLFSSVITRMTNVCRIYGESGYIEIPDFWKASGCKLYDKDYNLIDSFNDNREAHGFIYEMQHANEMIMAGEYESPVLPHSRSNAIQETMKEIRNQIGLKYPFED